MIIQNNNHELIEDTSIKDGDSIATPMGNMGLLRFKLIDPTGDIINPDLIWGIELYRIARSGLGESDIEADLIFSRSLHEASGQRPLWSSDDQGDAGPVLVSASNAVFDVRGLQDGLSHSIDNDVLIVDGFPLGIPHDRVFVNSIPSSPPDYNVDRFNVTIDLKNMVRDGVEARYIYAKNDLLNGIKKVDSGCFDISFTASDFKFLPGRYISYLEFEAGGIRSTAFIEFTVRPEPLAHMPSVIKNDVSLNDLIPKNFPFFYVDHESGTSGNFGDVAKFINSFLDEQNTLVSTLPQMWDVLVCPTVMLEYVAWEYGTTLYGNNSAMWRKQVINFTDRLKAKGSVASLKDRLEDCGSELEDFSTYFQVRSRKFYTDHWIVDPSTPLDQDSNLPTVKHYKFKLSKSPWFFPDGVYDPKKINAFFVLEARSENDAGWTRIPHTYNDHSTIAFERGDDGEWMAVVSLHYVDMSSSLPTAISVIPGFDLNNFDQVRLTYPVAQWGLLSHQHDFCPESYGPATYRSGFAAVSRTIDSENVYVSIGESGSFLSPSVRAFNASNGEEVPLENISQEDGPEPRSGCTTIHFYHEDGTDIESDVDKLLVYGGISQSGNLLDDTWIVTIVGDTYQWEKHNGQCPPKRSGMSYIESQRADGSRSFCIFGGSGLYGLYNDTWEWLSDGSSWYWQIVSYDPKIGSSSSPLVHDIISDPYDLSSFSIGDTIDLDNGNETVSLGNICYLTEDRPNPGYLKLQASSYPDASTTRFEILDVHDEGNGVVNSFGLQTVPSIGGHESVLITYSTPYQLQIGQSITVRQSVLGSHYSYFSGVVTSVDTAGSGGPYVYNVLVDSFIDNDQFPFGASLDYDVIVDHIVPTARCGASSISTLVSDTSDVAMTFLFGGMSPHGEHLDDTWCFHIDEGWYPLFPYIHDTGPETGLNPYPRPPARSYANMIRDIDGAGTVSTFVAVQGGLIEGHKDTPALADNRIMNLTYALTGYEDNTTIASIVDPLDPAFLEWVVLSDIDAGLTHMRISDSWNSNVYSNLAYPLFVNGKRNNGAIRVEAELSGSDFIVTDVATVYRSSIHDFNNPVVVESGFFNNDSGRSFYDVEFFTDGLHVYSEQSAKMVYTVNSHDPIKREHYYPNMPGNMWSMIPPSRRIEKKLYAVPYIYPAPVGVRDTNFDQNVFVGLSDLVHLSVTSQDISSYGISSPNNVIALYRIIDSGGDELANGYIDDSLIVHENPSIVAPGLSIVDSVTYDPMSGCVVISANVQPLELHFVCAQSKKCILPPLGTYIRVDDGIYALASTQDGQDARVTVVEPDGNQFTISSNNYIIVYNSTTEDVELWMCSEEKPIVDDGTQFQIESNYPLLSFDIGPVPVLHKRSFDVVGDNETFVLAQGIGQIDILDYEPSVRWSDFVYESNRRTQNAELYHRENDWKIAVVNPDGSQYEIPLSSTLLEKRLNYENGLTEVVLSFKGHDNNPVHGARIVVSYPIASGVRVSSPLHQSRMKYGLGDFIGDKNIDAIGYVNHDHMNSRVAIYPSALYDIGLSSLEAPIFYRRKCFNIDFDNDDLDKKPFHDERAYHAPDDANWTMSYFDASETIWNSKFLVSIFYKDSSGLIEVDSPSDVGMYSPLSKLVVSLPSGYDVGPMSLISLSYPVSTIRHDGSLIDLLYEVSAQEKFPDMADSVMSFDDWIDLYILSLPKADIRRIEESEVYHMWKRQVLADGPVVTYPYRVDENTRLIDRRDTFLPLLCADLNAFPSRVFFGKVRSQVPYGKTIFNVDEFDGSTRDSENPCDIDVEFLEPCGCCPSSAVGYVVNLPIHLGITVDNIKAIVDEMLPAHAIVRFASYKHMAQDYVRRPSDLIEVNTTRRHEDYCYTWNPAKNTDGINGSPRVTSYLRGNLVPEEEFNGIAMSPSGGTKWRLEAPELRRTAYPFAGQKSFCITDSKTKRLEGIERTSESTLVFKDSLNPPTSGFDIDLDYEVYNTTTPIGQGDIIVSGSNVYLSFSNIESVTSGVRVGDIMCFHIGLDSTDAATLQNAPSTVYVEIKDIVVRDEKLWFAMDATSTTGISHDFFSSLDKAPKAISIISGSHGDHITLSNARLINPSYEVDSASSVHRGRLENILDLPMVDYSTATDVVTFKLPRGIMESCYRLNPDDVASMPDLFSGMSVGDIVDGFGSVYVSNGDRLMDFYVQTSSGSTTISTHMYPQASPISPPVSTYNSATREIVFEFDPSYSFEMLSLKKFQYVSSKNNAERNHVRQTAVVMPRSSISEYDIDPRHYLFVEWQDGYSNGWVRQSNIDTRTIQRIRVESGLLSNSDVKVGDYVFLDDSSFLHGYYIDNVDSNYDPSYGYLEFEALDMSLTPTASQDFTTGRLVVKSSVGRMGKWTKVNNQFDIDVDILSQETPGVFYIPDSNYRNYGDVPRVAMIRLPDGIVLEITKAMFATGNPDTSSTRFIFDRYLPEEDFPDYITMIVLDLEGFLNSDMGRSLPPGGSEVEFKVINTSGTLQHRVYFS